MTTATKKTADRRTVTPVLPDEVVDVVRSAHADGTPLYPVGGGTNLDLGVAPRGDGLEVKLTGLNRIVDHPARDMTVTVEAGLTIRELSELLAREGQRLPIDVPHAEQATLGGVIAANVSGPRRFGRGTIRDYVIGISAVDGRGTLFKAGGRVVKNVAGYDFCKLLTGSLGTLAIITQATLKVQPIPETSAFVVSDLSTWDHAEALLAGLTTTQTAPTAVELLSGPAWRDVAALGEPRANAIARLVVGFEGTRAEVAWQVDQLSHEWEAVGLAPVRSVPEATAAGVWGRLVEFPGQGHKCLLKAAVVPRGVSRIMELVHTLDPTASLQAHAGSGVVLASLDSLAVADLPKALIGQLRPAAAAAHGGVTVAGGTETADLPRQIVWGPATQDWPLMRKVKQQFDPRGILNPGRFVY